MFEIKEVMTMVSPETKEYLTKISELKFPADSRELARVIDIGVSVIKRVELTRDVEYIKKEAKNIAQKFDKSADQNIHWLKDQLVKVLAENFDPNKDSSYLKVTVDYLRAELESFKDGVKAPVKLMLENAEKVSTNKLTEVNDSLKDIKEKLNPDLSTSYLGILKNTVVNVEDDIKALLDNSQIGSFAYNLEEELGKYFGEKSPILEEVQLIVNDFGKTINNELILLREEIAKKEGADEMLKSTAIKGFAFEDEVEDSLSKYASINNEVYVNTAKVTESGSSKKGDFVYEFEGGTRITIEAKDKLYNNLKPTLKYLDEAMENRSCTFAILVAKDIAQLPKNSLGFNLYEGDKLLTTLEFLPYALQFVRLYTTFQDTDTLSLNTEVFVNGVERLQNQIKNFTTIKTKLTTLANNTSSATTDVKGIVDNMHNEFNEILLGFETELKK